MSRGEFLDTGDDDEAAYYSIQRTESHIQKKSSSGAFRASYRRLSWLEKTRKTSSGNFRSKVNVTFELPLAENLKGLYTLRFNFEGTSIVLGFGSGAIQVRDQRGMLTSAIKPSKESSSPIYSVRFHPKLHHLFYAGSGCGSIFLCNMEEENYKKYQEEKYNEINALDVNKDGGMLGTAGKDITVRLYDTRFGRLISKYGIRSEILIGANLRTVHRLRIFALRFHPDNSYVFITGGWDDTVRVWDSRQAEGSVRTINGPHICGEGIDIRNNELLTASWVVANSLQLWDFGSGKLIDNISPKRPDPIGGDFLFTAQYFKGDETGDLIVCAGSGTGQVEVISIKERRIMGSFLVQKTVQCLDTNDKRIVFGGMETVLRIGDYG